MILGRIRRKVNRIRYALEHCSQLSFPPSCLDMTVTGIAVFAIRQLLSVVFAITIATDATITITTSGGMREQPTHVDSIVNLIVVPLQHLPRPLHISGTNRSTQSLNCRPILEIKLLTMPLGNIVVVLAEIMRPPDDLLLDSQCIWRRRLDFALRVEAIIDINDEDSIRGGATGGSSSTSGDSSCNCWRPPVAGSRHKGWLLEPREKWRDSRAKDQRRTVQQRKQEGAGGLAYWPHVRTSAIATLPRISHTQQKRMNERASMNERRGSQSSSRRPSWCDLQTCTDCRRHSQRGIHVKTARDHVGQR